jgi:anti-sigma factor ChrR (cupin superfamily)
MPDRVDGGWWGAGESGAAPKGPSYLTTYLQQAADMGEHVPLNAEGYEIRAERWMDRWMVHVRVRVRHDDDTSEWCELLTYQTGHYEFTDPNVEAQSLCMAIARRLE